MENKHGLKSAVWILLSLCIILLDQYSKWMIAHYLLLGQIIRIGPLLNLSLSFNSGAAFSFLGQANGWQIFLFTAISILVSLFLLFSLFRVSSSEKLKLMAMALILGGAIGNLIDRIRLGYVIDFIDFHIKQWHFATFNIADSAICVGAILFIYSLLRSTARE